MDSLVTICDGYLKNVSGSIQWQISQSLKVIFDILRQLSPFRLINILNLCTLKSKPTSLSTTTAVV